MPGHVAARPPFLGPPVRGAAGPPGAGEVGPSVGLAGRAPDLQQLLVGQGQGGRELPSLLALPPHRLLQQGVLKGGRGQGRVTQGSEPERDGVREGDKRTGSDEGQREGRDALDGSKDLGQRSHALYAVFASSANSHSTV